MIDVLGPLDAVHPRELPGVVRGALTALPGVADVRVHVLDQEGTVLMPYPDGAAAPAQERIAVEGTPLGAAVVVREPVIEPVSASRTMVCLPLSVRSEVLGVLEVECEAGVPSGAAPSPEVLAQLIAAGRQVAYAMVTLDQFSDHLTVARRVMTMSLPAELQWSNLPIQALTGTGFSVAARVLPAYEVGGDLFDISWEGPGVWVTVTDAVGHGLRSSILAFSALGTIRHARRCGLGLVEQAAAADETLLQQWSGLDYVTGLVGHVDPVGGVFRWVNAGHLAPVLLRGGHLETLNRPTRLPMGLIRPSEYVVHEVEVRPGDRLLLFSDGVPEARGTQDKHTPLGIDRLNGALLATASRPPVEAVRAALRLVEDWTGRSPRDDATLMVVDVTERA